MFWFPDTADDISAELAFPANRSFTFVFVYMLGAEVSPKQVEVEVISRFLPFINPSVA